MYGVDLKKTCNVVPSIKLTVLLLDPTHVVIPKVDGAGIRMHIATALDASISVVIVSLDI